MNQLIRLCCVSLLCTVCLSNGVVFAQSGNADLTAIHAKIEQLQQQNKATEMNRSQAVDALQQSERAISVANRNLFELDQQHQQTEQTLNHLHTQTEAARKSVIQQQNELVKLIRQQYFSNQADVVKLIMNGNNPNQIARNLIYFGYLSRARNQLISSLQQNLQQLDQLTLATQQQQALLGQQRQERQQQRQLLQAQRQQKKLVLKQLGSKIQQQHQQLATLIQNEKRITELLQKLARSAAQKKARKAAQATKSRPPSRTAATMTQLPQPILPDSGLGHLKGHLISPTRGELIHRFGTPRELGGTLWKGLFIKAPAGQAVHSVANGQVVFADWLRGFGNLIIINHGGGYMSLYSDNETLYKRVGDTVKAGDVIASVGNTGGSNETGLYFELRYQSQAFDPSNWIAR